MPPRFAVSFEDRKGFFYPGETIAGNIIVEIDKPIRCREITLTFQGDSFIHWTIQGSFSDGSDETVSNYEQYHYSCETLLAPEPPDSELTLQPGRLNYPFQFQLRSDLPPSVDAALCKDHGFVRYFMKVKIRVQSRLKSNIKETFPIQILASPVPVEELNQMQHLFEPVTITEEKLISCLICCGSGPIRLRCKIQKQVYYVGEKIAFSFEIDNKETGQELGKIEAKLIGQFTLFTDRYLRREYKHIKSSIKLSDDVAPRTEMIWNDAKLNIPTNIIPSFDNCKCMILEHYIEVKIDTLFSAASVFIPIIILNGPEMVQPVRQPPLMSGNVMSSAPGMVYPPPLAEALPPPMGMRPPTGSLPHPLTITQQPTSASYHR